jgi:PAS domain S-box-containing protein
MLVLDLIIGMLFISGISMAALGLFGKRFVGRVPTATPYVLLMFCAAAWAVLYALDLLTVSLPLRVFYHNLRFLFIPFFSVLEIWLVLAYVKKTEWLRRDWAALLLIIPAAAAILATTSPYHSLFRYNFSINLTGPVPVLQFSESGFYFLYFMYSLILLVLAIVLLITETRKKGILWEPQTIILLLALGLPTGINYASIEGLTPVPGVNMAPVLLWIPAILYTVALFRYQFLDIIPIARSRLIETLSKPVLVLDTEGRVIDMNPAASLLFSRPLPMAIGKTIMEIVPDWPEFVSLCQEQTAGKKELVHVKDGLTHYYVGSGEPLLTRLGEIEGHLIFLQDVTDLKMTEKALRESEAKYRAIIDEMQDMFYRTDIQGRITMLSPSAVKLSGYNSIDELLGKDVTQVYADPAEREKLLAALKEKGAVFSYPIRLRTRGGAILYVTTSSHFYRDAAGVIQGVEGVIHDITEQRRAEEALRMANKKLNLLSSVTRHDIRNQLFALMAFQELSERALDNPSELTELLKKNRKIAQNIAEQITFTKDYEDLGLNAPSWQKVSDIIGRAAGGLPVRNIQIRVETADLELFADPLIEKVFYNLVDNSLRYGGGKMTTIRIGCHLSSPALIVFFDDDGTGIADRDKAVIFDKGFGKNTGLGLFLSREILSITGITIAETGIFGKGARFEMTVPEGGFRFGNTNSMKHT